MSYRVVESNTGYDVIEKETEVVIKLAADEKVAKDVCRKLNLGSGFSGWTPMFFAGKI
jgi:hypothetical protein